MRFCILIFSLLSELCTGWMPVPKWPEQGWGMENWSLAVQDGWRNCSVQCLTCTAGLGLLLTGIPGRRGIRNKEAGKAEGPLERREGRRLSSSHCIWKQMFSISPAPKGRKWWAQLGERGYSWQTAPVCFFLTFWRTKMNSGFSGIWICPWHLPICFWDLLPPRALEEEPSWGSSKLVSQHVKLQKGIWKPTPQTEPFHTSRADVPGTNRLVCLYSSPTSTFLFKGIWGLFCHRRAGIYVRCSH